MAAGEYGLFGMPATASSSSFPFRGNAADLFKAPLPLVKIPAWPVANTAPPPESFLFEEKEKEEKEEELVATGTIDMNKSGVVVSDAVVNDTDIHMTDAEPMPVATAAPDDESSSIGPPVEGDDEKNESPGEEEEEGVEDPDDSASSSDENDAMDIESLQHEEFHAIRLDQEEIKRQRDILNEGDDDNGDEMDEEEDDDNIEINDDDPDAHDDDENFQAPSSEDESVSDDDGDNDDDADDTTTKKGGGGEVLKSHVSSEEDNTTSFSLSHSHNVTLATTRHLEDVSCLSVGYIQMGTVIVPPKKTPAPVVLSKPIEILPPAPLKEVAAPDVVSEDHGAIEKMDVVVDNNNNNNNNKETPPTTPTIQQVLARYDSNIKLPTNLDEPALLRALTTVAHAHLQSRSGDQGQARRLASVRDNFTVVGNSTPAIKEQINHLAQAHAVIFGLSQSPDINYKLFPK